MIHRIFASNDMGYFSKCRFFGPTLIQLIRISKTELRNLHFNKLSGWFISTWKLGKHWPNQNEVMDHPLYWRWVLVPWCSIEWEGSVNVTSSFTVKDVVQFLDLILQFHQFKIFPLITITYYYLPENFLHLGLFPNSGPTLDAGNTPSLHEYFILSLEQKTSAKDYSRNSCN